jgi:hypothetical protein
MRRAVGVGITMGIVAIMVAATWAQDDEYEGPMSNMHFVVVRDSNGKPVRNAAVVLHPITRKGKQAMGGMELKTDSDGKAGIDGIPYGPLRVQALASGFQTFGEDYEVNRPEMEIMIRLKHPVGQFSAYGNQGGDKKTDDKKPDANQPDQKPQ